MLSGAGVSRAGGEIVLAACSGGLDSVVLAHAAVELLGGRRVIVAHVDHAVRAGSAEDAGFVHEYARALGVEASMVRLEAGARSEERLRELRYRALESMRAEKGARLILIAHTEEDQAETVLLGLVRSARLARLAGMPARRGAIVRPLLGVPRSEVRAYAAAKRLTWREDPSNAEPEYLRNRVRKELVPLLERRYRGGIGRRLARLAAEVRDHLQAESAPKRGDLGPSIEASRPNAFDVARVPSGGSERSMADANPGAFAGIRAELRPWSGGALPNDRSIALFDADILPRPALRLADPKDRITPFGMDGTRKLGDVLREAGIPPEARRSCLAVTREDGTIVWVPGVVRSGDAPVTPLTRHVWVFWKELQDQPRSVTVDHRDSRHSITLEDGKQEEE